MGQGTEGGCNQTTPKWTTAKLIEGDTYKTKWTITARMEELATLASEHHLFERLEIAKGACNKWRIPTVASP